ncbi:hypothetical protein CEXT_691131 [Caerostris extrusa]|uniref:Uncharacterized protein n=1 Tax=Caerostris extrusa TaxID=172846 RepID=A0AAV4STJ1_CAEEX|nr:hypothetical protein CEXT_691131 [Caerostris extrusa]
MTLDIKTGFLTNQAYTKTDNKPDQRNREDPGQQANPFAPAEVTDGAEGFLNSSKESSGGGCCFHYRSERGDSPGGGQGGQWDRG